MNTSDKKADSKIKAYEIAGILNLSKESSLGNYSQLGIDELRGLAKDILSAGATIIDIGAEATNPQSNFISSEREWGLLEPVISNIRDLGFISIDTYKSETAELALRAGVNMINDISGLRHSADMAKIVADYAASIVIMHSYSDPKLPHARPKEIEDSKLISRVVEFLKRQTDYALSCGISESKIILDPGMGGFISSNPLSSWLILEELPYIIEQLQPFPVYLGVSRKAFLKKKGEKQIAERDELASEISAKAIAQGAKYIRTHNPASLIKAITSSVSEH